VIKLKGNYSVIYTKTAKLTHYLNSILHGVARNFDEGG